MNKKQKVELIIAAFLIICGSLVLIFPLFQFVKVKFIFISVLAVYGLLNLIKFILVRESKDYEGLLEYDPRLLKEIIYEILN